MPFITKAQNTKTKSKQNVHNKSAPTKVTQVKLHDSAKTNVANKCSTKCKAQSMNPWVTKTTRTQKLVQQVSKHIGVSTSHEQTKPPNFQSEIKCIYIIECIYTIVPLQDMDQRSLKSNYMTVQKQM
jgi:hypothetical protein